MGKDLQVASVSHIKIEFNNAAVNKVVYYALDQETLRKAQLWQGQQTKTPAAELLAHWLDNNGGQLDRADGPAYVATYADGTHVEEWCSKGQLDRADGPALVETYPSGRRTEAWYSKGQLDRTDGPALVETYPGGSRIEKWYSKGQLDRADGPAVVETYSNGRRIEKWFSKGQFVRESAEIPGGLQAIPGVTLCPMAP